MSNAHQFDRTTARVSALLRETPLVDGHNDLAWAMHERYAHDLDAVDLARSAPKLHTDLARLRAGGVGAQFWSVYVPARLQGESAVTATLEQVDFVRRFVARYPDDLALASTADEVEDAFGQGRIASLMGMEGGHSINMSLGTLRMIRALGVRYMTLTHNDNVPWADSATDEPIHRGLAPFGEDVVREMNRIGMLVDLSHVSADVMRHALRITAAPVLFSHSSARALCDVPRNVPDDVLESLPANGGVCMVTFVPKFVTASREGATVDDVVAHVEHVRDVAGVDHVGIGGDYDGSAAMPRGLEDVSTYPTLLAALADRGWNDDDLAKLAGRNALRVLRAAEEIARA